MRYFLFTSLFFFVACASTPEAVEHVVIVEEGADRYVVNGKPMTVNQTLKFIEDHWLIGEIRFVTFEKRDYQNGLIERLKMLALQREIEIEWDLPKSTGGSPDS